MIKKISLIILTLVLMAGGYLVYQLSVVHEVWKTPVYDNSAPTVPEFNGELSVLVFSKTNGFRHVGAIDAVEKLFLRFSELHNWSVFITENAAIHNPEQLEKFDVVVWNNVVGDVLTEQQRKAFKQYMENGGKLLALHGTGGTDNYLWQWHPETLIKARFSGHPMFPQFRDATLSFENQQHPAIAHFPKAISHNEEWYSFYNNPREHGVTVLATVNESDYSPNDSLTMGQDHPIIWYHRIEHGWVFFSALGHKAEYYSQPAQQRMLEQAVIWLAKQ